MRLLVATSNAGKIIEITHEMHQAGLAEPHFQILALKDLPPPPPPEPVEDRPTFLGNALKKARHYAAITGLLTLADDSGLCVDALRGAPGVYSARYAGQPCDNAANNAKLLREMHNIPDHQRQAQFVCAMALALPNAHLAAMLDDVHGTILRQPQGDHGFGYDPLFFFPQFQKTTAELDLPTKNQISHRGKTLRRMIAWIKSSNLANSI